MFLRRNRRGAGGRRRANTDVHQGLSRYLEWAQDAIVVGLALVILIVMVQGLWTLGRLALVLGREPRIVLPQIVLLLLLVELFRTILFYLREHRVDVGLMIEVAIVAVLRELLINPPGSSMFDAAGIAMVLFVLGVLLVADRLTESRNADPEPDPAERPISR
jgi:uncharacterized membrane protein (DUF373 family)